MPDSLVPKMHFYRTRKRVCLENLEPEHIDIEDIAHCLSTCFRFSGNTARPYSVLEHSVMVAQMVQNHIQDSEIVLQALMHDAPEYIIGDVPAPVKTLVPEIGDFEKKIIWPVIADRYGIDPVMHKCIKDADWTAFYVEAYSLCDAEDLSQWENYDEYWPAAERWMETHGVIDPRTMPHPNMMQEVFLQMFNALMGERLNQAS